MHKSEEHRMAAGSYKLPALRMCRWGDSMHIMILEDEPVIRQELKIVLENAMYQVSVLETFEDAAAQILRCRPDLVLMDVNLPGVCGFDICMELRKAVEVPVIFLTSRTDSMDELTGILKGGDDYITKPYRVPILLARIAAVLKRTKGAAKAEAVVLSCHGVSLDPARCCLIKQEQQVELTKSEMKLLYLLFGHAGEFVAREELIEELWENQIFIDDNALSVHMTRIREKLRGIGLPNFIETKRGIGYRV